jgi:hypothetical protein
MVLGKDRIERLQASFRGEVIQPADFAYEKARKIWNASIDKRPGIIARCAGVADVMVAVNFARENELLGRGARWGSQRSRESALRWRDRD